MPEFGDVVRSWEHVAQDWGTAAPAVHPTGGDPEQWNQSGLRAAQQVVETVTAHIPVPDVLVDFGCGPCRVTRHLPELMPGTTVVGVDSSADMLEHALVEAKLGSLVRLFQDDGMSLEATMLEKLGRLADVVVSQAVWIHHSHRDGARLLSAVASAVTPGGFLALEIPCYEEAREAETWTDVTVWTATDLCRVADDLDLEVLELHVSPGVFSYEAPGPAHHRFQVLRVR